MTRRGTRAGNRGRRGQGLPGWVVPALVLLLSQPASDSPLGAAGDFHVIVNASNTVEAVSAEQLSNIFLKKEERWDGGFRASPVDQPADSACRESFSRAIHGKDVSSVRKYWRKLVFSGLGEPPQELASDAAVVDFVAQNVGAVGYVCSDAPSERRVRRLDVEKGDS